MIDDQKLLCAFIHSAYESRYCGLRLTPELRERHKRLYAKFIADEGSYPEQVIVETQGEMMQLVNVMSVRDYIYRGHLEVVMSRIEEEAKMDFDQAVRNPMILKVALRCPVNLYEVVEVNGRSIKGRHLILGLEQRLALLDGLERPQVGNIVSGHWAGMLEVITDEKKLREYREVLERYFGRLRPAIDSVRRMLNKEKE
jgi:hypothetical protein